jgi:mutator protein MutT
MSENHRLDDKALELEIERIKILFEKSNYNLEEKKWFLEAKMISAQKDNDVFAVEACKRLIKELKLDKITTVVAALIEKDGKYLIAKRNHGNADTVNKWEFPGGKVEIGESEEEAIEREIREEFEMEVKAIKFVNNCIWEYPERIIDLRLYECKYIAGDFHLHDHSEYRYVEKKDFLSYTMCPADIPLAKYVKESQL